MIPPISTSPSSQKPDESAPHPWRTPSLFVLTCISVTISTLTFVLSMLHFGFFSFWTVPIVFTFTMGYHAIILTLEHFRQDPVPEQRTGEPSTDQPTSASSPPSISPSSSVYSIISASLLVSLWIGCFAILLVIDVLTFTTPPQQLQNNPQPQLIFLGSLVTNKAILATILSIQCGLCLVEALVMVITATRCAYERTMGRRESWKLSPPSFPPTSAPAAVQQQETATGLSDPPALAVVIPRSLPLPPAVQQTGPRRPSRGRELVTVTSPRVAFSIQAPPTSRSTTWI
ncbi:hypothetical protein BDN72DRAFT_335856 [Pluteus cervinus]|uniref:Uncharacterized protein n=1 Tax=Pluteus cervinus TaxID=181527 RepID=A0ACD3B431_9AGAR|nr:hypothetical protein BDN72DRAFT_335856 [Pluteus cervinus]